MKKKFYSLVPVVLIFVTLVGCGRGEPKNADKLLYSKGLEIIDLMSEMANSEDYIAVMTSSSMLSDVIEQIRGGDYSSPNKVFKVTIPDGVSAAVIEESDLEALDLSERLRSELEKRMISSAAVRLNGLIGAETIAAASMLSAGDSFICEGLNNSVIYVYQFDKGASVLLTFVPGDENIVSASGLFTLSEKLKGASAEDITALLAEGAYLQGCSTEELRIT